MVLSMVDNINREDSSKGDQPTTGTFIAKLKDEIEQRYTQDDLNQQVASPFGDMTLDEFLGIIWIDTFTHAWDIADAGSVDHGIPSEMAIEAYKIMQPRSESMRGPAGLMILVQPRQMMLLSSLWLLQAAHLLTQLINQHE